VVKDDEEIMLINSQGVLIRLHVDDISVLGRSTSGVRLMKTDESCCVVSTARIVEKSSDEEE
jgi:DNA gyrase subunit A